MSERDQSQSGAESLEVVRPNTGKTNYEKKGLFERVKDKLKGYAEFFQSSLIDRYLEGFEDVHDAISKKIQYGRNLENEFGRYGLEIKKIQGQIQKTREMAGAPKGVFNMLDSRTLEAEVSEAERKIQRLKEKQNSLRFKMQDNSRRLDFLDHSRIEFAKEATDSIDKSMEPHIEAVNELESRKARLYIDVKSYDKKLEVFRNKFNEIDELNRRGEILPTIGHIYVRRIEEAIMKAETYRKDATRRILQIENKILDLRKTLGEWQKLKDVYNRPSYVTPPPLPKEELISQSASITKEKITPPPLPKVEAEAEVKTGEDKSLSGPKVENESKDESSKEGEEKTAIQLINLWNEFQKVTDEEEDDTEEEEEDLLGGILGEEDEESEDDDTEDVSKVKDRMRISLDDFKDKTGFDPQSAESIDLKEFADAIFWYYEESIEKGADLDIQKPEIVQLIKDFMNYVNENPDVLKTSEKEKSESKNKKDVKESDVKKEEKKSEDVKEEKEAGDLQKKSARDFLDDWNKINKNIKLLVKYFENYTGFDIVKDKKEMSPEDFYKLVAKYYKKIPQDFKDNFNLTVKELREARKKFIKKGSVKK